eukprot:PhF_6_TR26055/c2_g1_i6/m.36708
MIRHLLGFVFFAAYTHARVFTFQGIPNAFDLPTCTSNRDLFQAQVQELYPGDTFHVTNNTYCLQGNLTTNNIRDVTILIDGTLKWSKDVKAWPRDSNKTVTHCWSMYGLHNVTFTSSTMLGGVLDGSGEPWWGYIHYLEYANNRPRLFSCINATEIHMSNLFFQQSPLWTVWLNDIADVHIHHCRIENRVDNADYHDFNDLGAFNTDGFDVAGRNVHIHDCYIWNQDDCIAVKQVNGKGINSHCSENMLFENIYASGVGLTIGSIGPSEDHTCVRNITFRNSILHNTFKGIYLKSRPESGTGEITDVLYENITIQNSSQWAFWIGPQQAAYPEACNLLWPYLPNVTCYVPSNMNWSNLTFRNIYIQQPQAGAGVIYGNETNPMKNIVFDNVVTVSPGPSPFKAPWFCKNVQNFTV